VLDDCEDDDVILAKYPPAPVPVDPPIRLPLFDGDHFEGEYDFSAPLLLRLLLPLVHFGTLAYAGELLAVLAEAEEYDGDDDDDQDE
jgi:hypothetical protein